MADSKTDNKTTLFFVKNLNHQFGPVESFLKKRGYNVVVESDPNIALEMLLDSNPEYIFLAWDHKVDSIRQMPKTIYQSCTGQVVPFIMSTQRDQIIQLESSGFENRLYPPLSGPAIVRLISKFEKQNQVFEQINRKAAEPGSAKKESEMIQVKSFFTEDKNDNAVTNVRTSFLADDEQSRKKVASRNRDQAQMFAQTQTKRNRPLSLIQQGSSAKSKLMTEISSEIDSTESMTQIQKSSLKNNLMSAVEKEFSSNGTQSSIRQSVEKEIDQMTDYHPDHQMELKSKLLALLDGELDEAFPELKPDDDIHQTTSSQLSKEAKKLSKGQVVFLDKTFDETIKPEMFDLIETYSDQASQTASLSETSHLYVLAIQELEWTGYLTVASESHLDVASAQIILNNWISQTIRVPRVDQDPDQQDDLADSVLFDLKVSKIDFTDFCSYKADFFKDVEYEGKKTLVGFFSFSPFQVITPVHTQSDMLELSMAFLKPNQKLPFDVNLYLTENKKFITYLRPDSFLDDTQISRLQNRKVEYIYSKMQYELAILKFKAEFNINAMVEDYKLIKGSR